MPSMDDGYSEYVPFPCHFHPEQVEEYPSYQDLPAERRFTPTLVVEYPVLQSGRCEPTAGRKHLLQFNMLKYSNIGY